VEAVGALPVAGGAVVGELELAGVAAVSPLRSSLSGIGPHLSLTRARGREPEQAARGSGPSRGSWAASAVGRPSSELGSGFAFLFIFVTDFS
jgi:hypothetical protein